jgi:hypothetical protein
LGEVLKIGVVSEGILHFVKAWLTFRSLPAVVIGCIKSGNSAVIDMSIVTGADTHWHQSGMK